MNDERSTAWMARLTRIVPATKGMLFALVALVAAGLPQSARADDPPAIDEAASFLRVIEVPKRSVGLEIASRRFVDPDGAGPDVTLVGVVHIGDRSYYRAVQTLLEPFDVVLYESVKPSGTGGAERATTDGERVAYTEAALRYVGGMIELHRSERGRYPEDLDGLRSFAAASDAREADFVEAAIVDAWGRTLVYRLDGLDSREEDAGGDEATYRLVSYGADGKAGGEGMDGDIVLDAPEVFTPLAGDDNLQSQLAAALGLSFQLAALDYDQAGWRCSDMSIDEVRAAMAARGSDFGVIESSLTGSSLMGRITRFMLGAIKMADSFLGGAISDMLKVVLIEMLGDEAMMNAALTQFDAGFTEVIIGERNQVVMDDLAALVADENDVGSVAILYGAGHMQDLSQRLGEQLGYVPGDVSWHTAIEVDLANSAMPASELKRLRVMMRRMIQQTKQMKQMGPPGLR